MDKDDDDLSIIVLYLTSHSSYLIVGPHWNFVAILCTS